VEKTNFDVATANAAVMFMLQSYSKEQVPEDMFSWLEVCTYAQTLEFIAWAKSTATIDYDTLAY
jgi:hypothetical protein